MSCVFYDIKEQAQQHHSLSAGVNQSVFSVDHRDFLDHPRVGVGSLLDQVVQHKDAAVAILLAWTV